jgi:hypothetical protein
MKVSPIFGHGVVVILLIVHLLIGYRKRQEVKCYEDDSRVKRVLGLKRLPDVATISRTLSQLGNRSVKGAKRGIPHDRIASSPGPVAG